MAGKCGRQAWPASVAGTPQGILPLPRVRNLSPILLRLRVKNLGLKKDMLCSLRNPQASQFCCDGRDLSKGRESRQGQDWWLFFFRVRMGIV